MDPVNERLARMRTDLSDAQTEIVDVSDDLREMANKIRVFGSFPDAAALDALADRLAPPQKEASGSDSDVPF